MKKDCVLGVTNSRPTRFSATARRRCLPARRVAIRMPLCAAGRAASGNADSCTHAWTFGETRNPAGTWAAACPWRRRWATAGLHARLRVACSGTGLTGASGRPACGALHSALVGVQPTTVSGPRPSGPGKAAASSRTALQLRRASVVSTASASERVETTPRNAAPCDRNLLRKGGLSNSDRTSTARRGKNVRQRRAPVADRQPFSPCPSASRPSARDGLSQTSPAGLS